MQEVVTLADFELRMCGHVGKHRFQNAEDNRRKAGLGPSATARTPDNHIRGARTEFAGSIMLNLYWRPHVGELDQKDVGGLVEVRSTDLPTGHLIIKPKSASGVKANGPYMLVQIDSPHQFRYGGWVMAEWALENIEATEKHGDRAHWVPREALHDMISLLDYIEPFRTRST